MHWFPEKRLLPAFLLLWVSVLAIEMYFPRTNFLGFISFYSLGFLGYFMILKTKMDAALTLGLLIRLSLLFSLPTLSDDFYRFYWDGLLLLKGLNPYNYLPTEVPLDFEAKQLLLEKMNSSNYYSPYTPFLQVIFAFCAALGQSLFGFVVVFKLLIISAEVFTFFILKKLISSSWKINVWWLNPLIILEFSGNLHQEVFVILGLALVFYFFQHKENKAVLAFAFTVVCKLIPVIYLVSFFRTQQFSPFLKYVFAALVLLGLGYIFFFSEALMANYFQSIRYYFTVFEFNSSVFRIAQYLKDNVYGPLIYLPKVVMILGFVGLALWGSKNLKVNMLFCLTVFLLCSQSVHPWYIAPLLFFSVISHYRFPVLWSFLIGFTYITYQTVSYQQSAIVIGIEYVLLIVFIGYEIFNGYKTGKNIVQ